MSHTSISITFACKFCTVTFDTVAEFLDHKEANHFEEFINTKVIVFEERTDIICDVEYSSLPPLEIELEFLETENVLVENELCKETSPEIEAGTELVDANHVWPKGSEIKSRDKEIRLPLKKREIKLPEPEPKFLSIATKSASPRKKSKSNEKAQNDFPFQHENRNSLSLPVPVQPKKEMPAKSNRRVVVPTEVRRSIRKRFVSCRLRRGEVQIQNSQPQVQNKVATTKNVKDPNESRPQKASSLKKVAIASRPQKSPIQKKQKLTQRPKRKSSVKQDQNNNKSCPQSVISASIVKTVKISAPPPKLLRMEKFEIESSPQKVGITPMPRLHRQSRGTVSHSLKSEQRRRKKFNVTVTTTIKKDENGNKCKTYHQCDVCSKVFNWKRSLMRHSETHKTLENRVRPFKCVKCGKSFLLSYHLKDHLRRHSNRRPFKCPHLECGKAFKTNTNLITHLKSHSNMRPFKCLVQNCSKAYRQRTDLNEHIQTHTSTGERNYICTVHPCTKGFISDYKLKRHFLRAHAKKRKVKPLPTACVKVKVQSPRKAVAGTTGRSPSSKLGSMVERPRRSTLGSTGRSPRGSP